MTMILEPGFKPSGIATYSGVAWLEGSGTLLCAQPASGEAIVLEIPKPSATRLIILPGSA